MRSGLAVDRGAVGAFPSAASGGCARQATAARAVSRGSRFLPEAGRLGRPESLTGSRPSYSTGRKVSQHAGSTEALESEVKETEIRPGVFEGFWSWRGHSIRYQRSGQEGPAMLLVHGFGGNADHWRKNIAELGEVGQVWAIDLLGYGYSSKPTPDPETPNTIYNFYVWADQLNDFKQEMMGSEPAFYISNSIGGLPVLQAAVNQPEFVKGVVLMDISLRMLHTSKQPPIARPFIALFQKVLRTTDIGKQFFDSVAQPKTVKSILQEAYCDSSTVDDELVEYILQPGLQPGAVDVFLDFISYSSGPLPEDLIPKVSCPVSIIWGEEDPWEKVEWGRAFQEIDTVEEFVSLPGVGHCPQDEAPQLVNPVVRNFVTRHSMDSMDEENSSIDK